MRKRQRQLIMVGGVGGLVCLTLLGIIAFRAFAPRETPGALGSIHTIADIPLSGGSSRFDYQSLDPRTKLLFIAHLGAGIVTVFDTTANRVIANIAGVAGVHGVMAIPELGYVYASATDDHQVVAIDEKTLRIIAKIPAGVYPDGMDDVASQHKLFISDESGQSEIVIDTRSQRQIAAIALGGEAGNTQYDPLSQQIFVDVQTRNELVAIDLATEQIVARSPLPGCQHDHSLLLDVHQRLAFVACDSNNVLLVVDMPSMQVRSTWPVGDAPDVLAFDPGRHLLYCASESGTLSVFAERGRVVHKVGEQFIASEAHSIAVDQDTHRLYFPLENLDGRPVMRVALFSSPREFAAVE